MLNAIGRAGRHAGGAGRQQGAQRGNRCRRTHLSEVLLGAHRLATLGSHCAGAGGGGGL
jgi:hypothetical protein